ncbi:hypothetical protein HK405_007654 [Cladochytrium tenue]|nr:hypothetical protein HK405_007654 [Cladochytrium tenue]
MPKAVHLQSWIHFQQYVGEARLAHEVLSTRNKDFARPAHYYGSLLGLHHMLSTDGSDWRRQGRVLAPQFSDRNNALVLAETVRIAESMFSFWESGAVAKSVAPGSSRGRVIVCATWFGFDVNCQLSGQVSPRGRFAQSREDGATQERRPEDEPVHRGVDEDTERVITHNTFSASISDSESNNDVYQWALSMWVSAFRARATLPISPTTANSAARHYYRSVADDAPRPMEPRPRPQSAMTTAALL